MSLTPKVKLGYFKQVCSRLQMHAAFGFYKGELGFTRRSIYDLLELGIANDVVNKFLNCWSEGLSCFLACLICSKAP